MIHSDYCLLPLTINLHNKESCLISKRSHSKYSDRHNHCLLFITTHPGDKRSSTRDCKIVQLGANGVQLSTRLEIHCTSVASVVYPPLVRCPEFRFAIELGQIQSHPHVLPSSSLLPHNNNLQRNSPIPFTREICAQFVAVLALSCTKAHKRSAQEVEEEECGGDIKQVWRK